MIYGSVTICYCVVRRATRHLRAKYVQMKGHFSDKKAKKVLLNRTEITLFRTPSNHIGWTPFIPFASINLIFIRINPWKMLKNSKCGTFSTGFKFRWSEHDTAHLLSPFKGEFLKEYFCQKFYFLFLESLMKKGKRRSVTSVLR